MRRPEPASLALLVQAASAALLLASLGCGSSPCRPGDNVIWCRDTDEPRKYGRYPICCPESENRSCLCAEEPRAPGFQSLASMPPPDLTHSNLDGLVDFGRTVLQVGSGGDRLETRLMGRVVIAGGVCASADCPLRVLLVELEPVDATVTTADGRTVTGLFAANANVWTGTRRQNGAIVMNAGSKLAIEGTVDGVPTGLVLEADGLFEGSLAFNATRLTATGPVKNNRIDVTGAFASGEHRAKLSMTVWATDCQTVVKPSAACRPAIEAGQPGHFELAANFALLDDLQSSQGLCDAVAAGEARARCRVGGGGEFPTFTCEPRVQRPTEDPAAIARRLDLAWRDRDGALLGTQPRLTLDRVPRFPVALTVKNEWGKEATGRLGDAPVCTPDVPLRAGACAWQRLFGGQSHQRSDGWCPAGAYLTAIDLDGHRGVSEYEAPLVGYVRCCAAGGDWGACSRVAVGRVSHRRGDPWCAAGSFLTALDLDSDLALPAHDSPVVGEALCCAQPGLPASGPCQWVEVGRRSHSRGRDWCPAGSFLTALDLDGDHELPAHDSPIVGRALCCRAAE